MAYIPRGLTLLKVNFSSEVGGPRVWSYSSNDSAGTVGQPNYFSDALYLGVNEGDIISSVDTTLNESSQWVVQSVTTAGALINPSGGGGILAGFVNAADYGFAPDGRDCGPLFALLPNYKYIWFEPGLYTFATYPTQQDFSLKFYRGIGVIWQCTGALPQFDLTAICFDWTWFPPFLGSYVDNGSMNDMMSAGLSPIEGIGIVSQLDGFSGVGLRLGGPEVGSWLPSTFVFNYFLRPKNFSVGGFYINVGWTDATNSFLTGLESVVLKRGVIGLSWHNGGNSGENITFKDCDFNGLITDGYEIFATQRVTFDGCSFDYNGRDGYSSNAYTVFKSCYFETNGSSLVAENIAIDGGTVVILDEGTSILRLNPQVDSDFVASFVGSGAYASTYFKDTAFYGPLRQFVNNNTAPSAYNRSYGKVIGFNGINFPLAVAPSVLLQNDYNFASGGLSFYPGSNNAAVQQSIVRSPQANAVLLTANGGTATLGSQTIPVISGELLQVTLYDKIINLGIISYSGGITFKTADGTTIETVDYSQTASVPNFAPSGDWFAPNWGNNAPHDWALEQFVFAVPPGAAIANSALTITGSTLNTTTLDPGNITNINLSGGNLIATASAPTAYGIGTVGRSTGAYWQFNVKFSAPSGGAGAGVSLQSGYAGFTAAALFDSGSLYNGHATVGTTTGWVANQWGSVLLLFSGGSAYIYFAIDAANPVWTPYTQLYSALIGQTVYPWVYLGSTTNAATFDFSASQGPLFPTALPWQGGEGEYYISEFAVYR